MPDPFIGLAMGTLGALFAVSGATSAFTAWAHARDDELYGLAEAEGGTFVPRGWLRPGLVELERTGGTVRVGHLPEVTGAISFLLSLQVGIDQAVPSFTLWPRWTANKLEQFPGTGSISLEDPEFDHAFQTVGSQTEAVRQVLGARARKLCMGEAAAGGWAALFVRVERVHGTHGAVLTVERKGWRDGVDGLRSFLSFGCELADELNSNWARPWQRVVDRWQLSPTGPDDSTLRACTGTVRGTPMLVREGADRRGRFTEIVARAPMPQGLVVAHAATAKAAGWHSLCRKLGNPVLDMLVAAKAHDWSGATALLTDEELTARLLEVVHAHPGSELRDGEIRLVLPGYAFEELEPAVEKVLALAEALREASAR